MIQSLSEHYRYGHHAVPIQMIQITVTAAKKSLLIKTSGSIFSHLTFIQLNKKRYHIEFDFKYVELILCE